MDQFDRIVTVTRDPFDRFKSEFYWQNRRATDLPDPDVWITKTLEDAAADPFAQDNHLRPQTDFIPKGAEVQHFRLEDGIEAALNVAGGPLPEPGLRKRVRRSLGRVVRGIMGRSGSKGEKASTYQPKIEAAFAQRRADIVAFYAQDYTAFGYDPEPTLKT